MRGGEFYAFMQERENVRLRKEADDPWPWTEDKILQEYKFTNVKRANDRTTRWFWKVLDEHKDAPHHVILFNCALFRYFGTVEFYGALQTWFDTWSERTQTYVKDTAEYRLAHKMRVFTGAYVITNQGISAPKQDVVVDHFLTPFWDKCPDLVAIARDTRRWKAVAKEMMKLKGFGGTGFMTKEVLQDAIHTPVLSDCIDRDTWCPIGPGARRGLNRVFERPLNETRKFDDMLEELRDLWKMQTLRWPLKWEVLELHDIQFQLCEFDKYERVLHGEGRPRSKYRAPF